MLWVREALDVVLFLYTLTVSIGTRDPARGCILDGSILSISKARTVAAIACCSNLNWRFFGRLIGKRGWVVRNGLSA